jgi:CRP-like cAMP-binding protein
VEDCKVIAFKTREINELSLENIRILRLLNEGIKEAFAEIVDRVEFFAVLTPEQRYKRLMDESPDLIQRVPQKFLASYIGVTTVSLSRIRNR